MRNTLLLLLLFTMILSCKKHAEIIDSDVNLQWGTVNGYRNGKAWEAKCGARISSLYPGKFSLTFSQYNLEGYLRNSLNCRNIPYQIGVYYPAQFLFDGSQPDSILTVGNFTLIQDGDVSGDNYLAIRDSAVALTIDAINYNTGIISGSFTGTFVKTLTFGIEFDPASPDTFTYVDGHYEAKVIK